MTTPLNRRGALLSGLSVAGGLALGFGVKAEARAAAVPARPPIVHLYAHAPISTYMISL